MADDFKQYPRGNIAMDNGDLIQVTDVKNTIKRSNKIKHTLRKQAAGKVHGPLEAEVSFDSVVDETGPERDYLSAILQGKIKRLRLKIPGETITVVGSFDERSTEMPLDDAIKFSVVFSGRLVV